MGLYFLLQVGVLRQQLERGREEPDGRLLPRREQVGGDADDVKALPPRVGDQRLRRDQEVAIVAIGLATYADFSPGPQMRGDGVIHGRDRMPPSALDVQRPGTRDQCAQ